ncbi:hypothetical protein [Actinomadura sp. NPDC049753]|uniref:hypothetical protein n=1 Tax=Actinomadura sp. NPDC049753 TaxID=3154739 RepID=UPI00342539EC
MKKLQLLRKTLSGAPDLCQRVWKKVRQGSTDLYRRVTTKKIRMISIVMGAVLGAVVEGIAMGPSWMGAADSTDLDYLVSGAVFGAFYGTICGGCGVLLGACAPVTAGRQRRAFRTAVTAAVVGVAASLAMAGSSLAGLDIASGNLFVWHYLPVFCGIVAGMAVGILDVMAEARAEDTAVTEALALAKAAADD